MCSDDYINLEKFLLCNTFNFLKLYGILLILLNTNIYIFNIATKVVYYIDNSHLLSIQSMKIID